MKVDSGRPAGIDLAVGWSFLWDNNDKPDFPNIAVCPRSKEIIAVIHEFLQRWESPSPSTIILVLQRIQNQEIEAILSSFEKCLKHVDED